MAKGTVTHRIQIEKLRKLYTWVMRSEPFSGSTREDRKHRKAYEAGFTQRTQDFIIDKTDRVTGPHYKTSEEARAWERGYRDARGQDGKRMIG